MPEYKISLVGMQLVGFSLEKPTNPNLPTINETEFDFSIQHKISSEQKQMMVGFDIKLRITEDKRELASFFIIYTFSIENFEEAIPTIEGKATIPKDLAVLCTSIGVSTSRGVVFTHLKGTHLGNILLPIINPLDFHYSEDVITAPIPG